MLSCEEIKNIRLRKSKMGGYKAEDVEDFVDKAIGTMLKLEKDNLELLDKIKVLVQKNNTYKDEQESVRTTLIKAQKLADSLVIDAKKQAEETLNKANFDAKMILDEAKTKAESTVKNIESDVAAQSEMLANLKKSVKEFRTNVLNLYKEHIKIVNSLAFEESLTESNAGTMHKNAEGEVSQHDQEKIVEVDEKSTDEIKSEIPEEKKVINKKFINLKFGENYDVSKDNEETSLGLFSKT